MAQHVELCGRGVRQVDDAIADKGAAVVDPHHDAAPVLQIGDSNVGGQRQRLVSGRHAIHVVRFAGRGSFLVEAGPVPGGDTALPIADARGQNVVALAEHFVERRIAVARARFDARHGIRHGAGYRRRRGQHRRQGGGGGRIGPLGRAGAGRDGDYSNETERCGKSAAGIHCCKAGCGEAEPGASLGAARVGASFNRMRCLTAAASSKTAIAYSALWL